MDWKLLIAQLAERGYTQPQIAEACGCGQATISDLANGHSKEPRYGLGEKLKALHARALAEPPANDEHKARA